MISGRQIREARALIGWDRTTLCQKASIASAILIRAEQADGMPSITLEQAARLQAALEAAGVRFGRLSAVSRHEAAVEPLVGRKGGIIE